MKYRFAEIPEEQKALQPVRNNINAKLYDGDRTFQEGNPHKALEYYNGALQLHETIPKADQDPRLGEIPWKRFHAYLLQLRDKVRLLIEKASQDGAPAILETKRTLMRDKRSPTATVIDAAELIEVIGTKLRYILTTTRDGLGTPEIFDASKEVPTDFGPWRK